MPVNIVSVKSGKPSTTSFNITAHPITTKITAFQTKKPSPSSTSTDFQKVTPCTPTKQSPYKNYKTHKNSKHS